MNRLISLNLPKLQGQSKLIYKINIELKNENGNGNEELKNQIDKLKIENEELKKRLII